MSYTLNFRLKLARIFFVPAVMTVALVASSGLQAATYSWQPLNGDFNWQDPTRWSPSSGFPNAVGDVATFNSNINGGTRSDLQGQTRTVGIINIGDTDGSHSYTIMNGTLSLNNGGTAQINQLSGSAFNTISTNVSLVDNLAVSVAANQLNFDGVISGASKSVTKTGNGVLQLTNSSNSFSGGLNINGGTLSVNGNSGGNHLGTAAVTINSTGILQSNGNDIAHSTGYIFNGGTYRGLANNSNYTNQGNVTVQSGGGTFISDINGGGSYQQYSFGTLSIGTGTLTARTRNSSGGGVGGTGQITFGATTLTGDATFSTVAATDGNSVGNASIQLNVGALNDGGVARIITIAGVATTNLTAAATSLVNGTQFSLTGTSSLTLSNNTAIGTLALITTAAGTNFNTNGTGTVTVGGLSGSGGNINLSNSQQLTIGNTNNLTSSYTGIIQNGNSGSTVVKAGTGTQTLGGANTYTGATTINAGVLNIQHATGLGNVSGSTSVNSGGTLQLQGGITVGAEALSIQGTGAAGAVGALQNVSGTNNYGGTVTLGGAGGTGATISAHTGSTLNLTNTLATGGSARTVTFDGGGTINITGQVQGTSTSAANGSTIVKNGSGTVVLSNTGNNYTGTDGNQLNANGTRINAGILGITADSALGLTGGGAFQQILFTGNGTLQDTTNNITLNAFRRIGINTGVVATFDSNGNTFTIAGIIQNNTGNTASGIAKTGAGIVSLTGVNTYSGTTTINAGTLRVNGSAITDGSAVTIANVSGATLDLTATEAIGSLAGGGTTGGAVTLNANQLQTGGDGTSTSFGGVISGTGTVVKQGGGVFTLTNANTYNGDTFAVNGTLAFSGGGHVNSSIIRVGETSGTNAATLSITDAAGGGSINSTLVVRAGSSGTKTISATNTSNTSTYSGSVFLDDNATATSTNSGGTLAFTGTELDMKTKNFRVNGAGDTRITSIIKNTGGSATVGNLLKGGTGTLALSGANTYTGETAIDSGAIRIDGNAGSTGGTVFVGNGGTTGTAASLLLGGAGGTGGNITFANLIQINQSSGNNRTLGGVNSSGTTNTFSGTTFTNGAADLTVTSTNAGALLRFTNANAIDVKGRNVLFNGAGNTLMNGAIYNSTGSGSVTKQGAGTLTLAVANTYSGGTSLTGGTLLVNNTTGSGTGSGAVAVSGSGVLGGSGTIAGAVTVSGGGTLAPGNSPDHMAVANDVTLNGGTLDVELGGTSVGDGVTGYDQLELTGAGSDFSLVNSNNLQLTLINTFVPTVGDKFTIVLVQGIANNNSATPFATVNGAAPVGSLAQGGTFEIGGYKYQISYRAEGSTFDAGIGAGNDIMLQAVPEPTTFVMILGGFGMLLGFQRARRRKG